MILYEDKKSSGESVLLLERFEHCDLKPQQSRVAYRRIISTVASEYRMAISEITGVRVPPQNLEAEQSVLGAILLDNAALESFNGNHI